MKKTMMVDIARLADVSLKTVSRVVNKSPKVREETRKRVMKIIEQEGYMANIAAQGLRGRKTKTIIVFIDRHEGKYWNIWHNSIVNVIINESKKTGYKIVISPSSARGVVGDETDGFYLLKSKFADGAIIFDNKDDDVRCKYLAENKIPYVLVGKAENEDNSYCVDVDNYRVGFLGGEYLIMRKYSNIVQFVGSEDFIVNKERSRGFKDALIKYEMSGDVHFEVDSVEKAYEKACKLLETCKVDAFFVSGDERALGVYKAIMERNLKIPEDVAVLGIDNIHLSQFVHPSLSTIDQLTTEFGEKILNMLVDLLTGKPVDKKVIAIEPQLIERAST